MGVVKATMSLALKLSEIFGDNSHGVGIGQIQDERVIVHKSGSGADQVVNLKFLDHINGFTTPVIGHVRKASSNLIYGTNKKYPDADAHPFLVGNILLAHNGTVIRYTQLQTKENLAKEKIDSFGIAEMLSRLDVLSLENLNSVTEKLNGPCALIFQDVRLPDRIYMCKHGKDLELVRTNAGFGAIATSKYVTELTLSEIKLHTSLYGYSFLTEWEFTTLKKDVWYTYETSSEKLVELGKAEFKNYTSVTYRGATTYVKSTISGKRSEVLSIVETISEFVMNSLEISLTDFRILYEGLYDLFNSESYDKVMVEDMIRFLKDEILSSNEGVEFLSAAIDKIILKDEEKWVVYDEWL